MMTDVASSLLPMDGCAVSFKGIVQAIEGTFLNVLDFAGEPILFFVINW